MSILMEVVKCGLAKPVSKRRGQGTIQIAFLIGRHGDNVYIHLQGKYANGNLIHDGAEIKKWFSFLPIAEKIESWPSLNEYPASSVCLKDILPPDYRASGWIVSVLRALGFLIECPPRHQAYSPLGETSGRLSWRNPDSSIEEFIDEMLEIETIRTEEVPQWLLWPSNQEEQ